MHWWVDIPYNTHDDCNGHIGVMMYLGPGAVQRFFWKQKINNRSSIKGELVGVDDLGLLLCDTYAINAQGYAMKHKKL